MLPLSDSHPTGKFPFWVLLIIGINIYVFIQELIAPNLETFISQYALIPALVDPSNIYSFIPFITSQFLHGDFLHIISNMLFLWVFGDNVEARFGKLFFPFFYLLAGTIGGIAQFILTPESTIPMIGASGAVSGVLGAYFALFPHNSVKTLVPFLGFFSIVNIPASIMLFYWIFIQVMSGLISLGNLENGGVAYFAHIGGFVFGWLLAKLFYPRNQQQFVE